MANSPVPSRTGGSMGMGWSSQAKTSIGVSTEMKSMVDRDFLQWDHHSSCWKGAFVLNSSCQEGEPISSSDPSSCVSVEQQFLLGFVLVVVGFFSAEELSTDSRQQISVEVTQNLRARCTYWSISHVSCMRWLHLILLKSWITMALLINGYLQMGTSLESVICWWK